MYITNGIENGRDEEGKKRRRDVFIFYFFYLLALSSSLSTSFSFSLSPLHVFCRSLFTVAAQATHIKRRSENKERREEKVGAVRSTFSLCLSLSLGSSRQRKGRARKEGKKERKKREKSSSLFLFSLSLYSLSPRRLRHPPKKKRGIKLSLFLVEDYGKKNSQRKKKLSLSGSQRRPWPRPPWPSPSPRAPRRRRRPWPCRRSLPRRPGPWWWPRRPVFEKEEETEGERG